jgi:hypothetical protein
MLMTTTAKPVAQDGSMPRRPKATGTMAEIPTRPHPHDEYCSLLMSARLNIIKLPPYLKELTRRRRCFADNLDRILLNG